MARLLSKNEIRELLKTDLKRFAWYKGYENRNDIIMLNNGDLIEIRKPSIEKAMYYDDEYDAPSTAEDSFINYNIQYLDIGKIEKWKSDNEDYKNSGCCSGNLLHKIGISKCNTYGDIDKIKYYYMYLPWEDQDKIYYLDDIENEEFIQCIEQLRENFIKRLHTYYKKYHDKIYTHGCWANR